MITDSQTNTIYFSELLKSKFPESHANIAKALQELNIVPRYLLATNDIWARDYMPVQLELNQFLEYRYDPDYLQGTTKGLRDIKSYPDLVCERNNLPKTIKSALIMDGGNVVKLQNCVIMVDKVAKENRLSKGELERQLKAAFQVEKVILIPWYQTEKYGHADGVVRFIDEKTVLLHEIDKENVPLIQQFKKNGLDIKWLEFKVKKEHRDNWAYLNFLQIENAMLVPQLGIEEDHQALEQLKSYYRDTIDEKRIKPVAIADLVHKGEGALNCISWTIKE